MSVHASPKLESLTPTEAALRPNILRGHYQTAIWRSCASQDPPQASPEDYGWYRTVNRPRPDAALEVHFRGCQPHPT